jgi:hypothetical protein
MGFHQAGKPAADLVLGNPGQPPIIMPWFFEAVPCFLCYEDILAQEAWAFWQGQTTEAGLGEQVEPRGGQIFLHPTCAIKLAAHLCKDALLAEATRPFHPIAEGPTGSP